jgi:hypothetical protein
MMKQIATLMILLLVASAVAAQSAGKLTLEEKRALAQQACKDLGDPETGLDCKDNSINKIIKQIEFETIDLNGDGQAEQKLSVSAEVIKRVNIAFYQKAPQGYRLLFSGLSRGVEVKKNRTNGYYDLEEIDAGVGPFYTTYKYDGKKYREHNCWREDVDSRGRRVRVKC